MPAVLPGLAYVFGPPFCSCINLDNLIKNNGVGSSVTSSACLSFTLSLMRHNRLILVRNHLRRMFEHRWEQFWIPRWSTIVSSSEPALDWRMQCPYKDACKNNFDRAPRFEAVDSKLTPNSHLLTDSSSLS
jgi:hypothetical protein